MSTLPATGFLTLRDIIGDPKVNPPVPAIIPMCKASWYAGEKSGRHQILAATKSKYKKRQAEKRKAYNLRRRL